MGQIIDNKPEGGVMAENKPSGELNRDLSNKLTTRSVEVYTPYGLLLCLTYPETETFTTEYNP